VAWHGTADGAWLAPVSQGEAARHAAVCCAMVRHAPARQGTADEAWRGQVCCDLARPGETWLTQYGLVRYG